MLTATSAFSLITCNDIKTAALIANAIPRTQLHNRILLLKTSKGNFAKLYVQSADNLMISDLVVYNPAGCIIKTATNVVIPANSFCDVDNAISTGNNANADFWWHSVGPAVPALEPKNGAGFVRLPDFADVSFNTLSSATYSDHHISREWLKRQVLYCKTSLGRFAKLHIEWGNELFVRHLTVFNANGTQHLAVNNITLQQTQSLDLDTGVVAASGKDMYWEAQSADISTHYLAALNDAKFSFDSYYQYEKYLPLLKNSSIRSAMVISGASDRPYSNWIQDEKLQLREFIYLLETNKPLPLTGPPALIADTFISPCDALKIYMAHVAQCFWVDANNKVSWDLVGNAADHLQHLFDMRKLLKFTAGSGHSFDTFVMGKVTDWNPALSYKFLTDNNMIKADMWGTIKAVAEWVRANLFHIVGFTSAFEGGPFDTQQDQWENIFGYRGLPPVDKMITPLPGKRHVTHGCWGTDGFFAAVLRTVNIPVKHGLSNLSGNLHSRAEFFSVGKNLRHGDDPYNRWVFPGINNVPIERVFVTNAQLTDLIDSPPALPGKTVPETASFNHNKFSIDLAIEFKTSYLLKFRCMDKTSGINTGPGSKVWENLHEFYTDAQIATVVAGCDTAIAAIGGGCVTVNAS